jgi:putative addiction module CopG family antidote
MTQGDNAMQIELPPDLTEFVSQEVSAGHYKSAQDMIVEALRIQREERESAIAGIRRGWESAQRGEGMELAEADRLIRTKHGLPPRQ